ncbi:hypothetical protein B5F07_16995 [Lachnoclostridium sp. An169]|uniref:hypothetical protein n=1 Tax=Lachnoclostridium sp. An169 TaxID=1965569 RepID=UPI000B3A6C2D|nr:hypothetical protein [Lachnoclostridium sp. An169]OUP81634.1 hypothetical protein B5F07_16995 [Lachnoclostridium sp. An169]HJA65028.1 hypothetical protein [Candidatus Mediterraneibacter cottocaccae]
MRLKANADIPKFLTDVRRCSSEVYFETPDGDSLTLRSTLSQYIFCTLIDEPGMLGKGTIRLAEASDKDLLIQYLEDE